MGQRSHDDVRRELTPSPYGWRITSQALSWRERSADTREPEARTRDECSSGVPNDCATLGCRGLRSTKITQTAFAQRQQGHGGKLPSDPGLARGAEVGQIMPPQPSRSLKSFADGFHCGRVIDNVDVTGSRQPGNRVAGGRERRRRVSQCDVATKHRRAARVSARSMPRLAMPMALWRSGWCHEIPRKLMEYDADSEPMMSERPQERRSDSSPSCRIHAEHTVSVSVQDRPR